MSFELHTNLTGEKLQVFIDCYAAVGQLRYSTDWIKNVEKRLFIDELSGTVFLPGSVDDQSSGSQIEGGSSYIFINRKPYKVYFLCDYYKKYESRTVIFHEVRAIGLPRTGHSHLIHECLTAFFRVRFIDSKKLEILESAKWI